MNIYRTTDYTVAATLSAMDFKLLVVDRSDYRRATFEFRHEDGISQVVETFFRDELLLNPRLLLLHAKLVKDRLHAAQ